MLCSSTNQIVTSNWFMLEAAFPAGLCCVTHAGFQQQQQQPGGVQGFTPSQAPMLLAQQFTGVSSSTAIAA